MSISIQSRIRAKVQDLTLGDHAVCLYEADADKIALLADAISLGLERREKILCVLDMTDSDLLAKAFEKKGIDGTALQKSGQLSFVFPDATARRHEGPDPLALLAFYETASFRATAQGYSGLRTLAVMDAFIPHNQDGQRLVTYEAMVHTASFVKNSLFLCFYGMKTTQSAVLLEIIKSHVWIILGSRLNNNPFHLPPDVFLSVSRSEAEFAHAVQTLTTTPAPTVMPVEQPSAVVVQPPAEPHPTAVPAPASNAKPLRLLELLNTCRETLLEAQDEKALLSALCRHMVEIGGYRMAWAGTAGRGPARLVRSVAHAGEDAEFLASLQVDWNSPGSGPTGIAVKTGKPVALRRIPTDPSCVELRDQAARRGYAAVACLPWWTDDQTRGVLTLYATDPEAFAEDELERLRKLAAHTGLALSHLRTRGERSLFEQQLLLPELMLQTLSQPMLFLDPDGRILYANAACLRLWDCELEDDLTGRLLGDLAEKKEQALSLLRHASETGRSASRFEARLKNGTVIDLEADAMAVCDEMGQTIRLLAAFTPATDSKTREKWIGLERERDSLSVRVDKLAAELETAHTEAEAASRTKNDFLAGISHELRTPLNAVIGFSEVLLEPSFGTLNAKQTEYVNHILESGTHLQGLIDDILTISKVETGNLTLMPGPVALRPLLDESLAPYGSKCENQGLSLRLMVADSAKELTFRADAPKLKQILANLLSNAVKFTPEGGQILVTARLILSADRAEVIPPFPRPYALPRLLHRQPAVTFPCLELTVSDTGIGVDPSVHDAIFAEFFQVRNSPHRKPSGTGLGLALTRRFVNMHGGQVWVESEGRDTGSRFVCVIPHQTEATP